MLSWLHNESESSNNVKLSIGVDDGLLGNKIGGRWWMDEYNEFIIILL